MANNCDIPDAPSAPVVEECDTPKPLLTRDNFTSVELCRPSGPISVHFDRLAGTDECPPGDPGDPVIIGWTDLLSGAFTVATEAPADAVPCGETADFEAVRWCALDADGEPIADLLIEYEYDEDTRELVGSKILNPDGSTYSGPAYDSIGRCNDVEDQYTAVRVCRNGTIHIVHYAIDRDAVITELDAVDTAEPCGDPQYDVEIECVNSELLEIVYEDGVIVSRTVLGECPDALDFEKIRECRNNTIHIVTCSFDEDGNKVELSAIDTGESCPSASAISEVLVCVGGCSPAIRRTDIAADGTETITFIGEDGSDLTATAAADGWTSGTCQVQSMDTCFLPDQYAIIWAWNGSGDIMSFDPITNSWTDYGKTTLADGTTVGGYALTVKNDTTDTVIYMFVGDCLYKADPTAPTSTFQLVGCDASAVNSVPCMAFDPTGRLLIGDGRTVQAIDPDTGAVLSTGQILDQRKIDANAAVPGTYASEQANVSPGDWHFDPAGNWFMMARDNNGADFGVDTSTVLWKIDPNTLVATRVSNTDNPFGSGTGSSWFSANRHLLSSGSTVTTYNVLADSAPGTDSAWTNEIPNAPHSINDLGSQWIIPEPIRITGVRNIGCDPENTGCGEFSWCQISQDEITLEFTYTPFTPTVPGTFGECEAGENPFVTDPTDPGTSGGGGCEDCQHVWMDGCSDAGPTKWRETSIDGISTTYFSYGSVIETTTQPSGFSKIACADQIVPEITTSPVCDLDTGETVYRREETDETGTVTVTFFNETGTIAAPANFSVGECPPDPDSNVVVSDETYCVNGQGAIRRQTDVYQDVDGDGQVELISSDVIWFDVNGPIADPDPAVDEIYLGDCIPDEPALKSHHLIEGCINGDGTAAFTIVDETGTALFAPIALTSLGFDEECC